VRPACLALLALLAALPAQAQRSRCGFGLGLEGLRTADRMLAEAAASSSLTAGREAAGAIAARLHEVAGRLSGCGCHQAADHAAEAAGLADQAGNEAGIARLRRSLDRARFSLTLARERLDRAGCS